MNPRRITGLHPQPWCALLLLACCIHLSPAGVAADGSETTNPTAEEASNATSSYGLRLQPLESSRRGNTKPHDDHHHPTSRKQVPRPVNANALGVAAGKSSATATSGRLPHFGEDDDGRDNDSMAMADAGDGRRPSSASSSTLDDEKKSLAQQVADGKYGLIQDLLPKEVKRPGILSYAPNPEVPKDTKDNLGGLGQEDIWLAEDHVLVLAGGGFRDKGGGLVPPWPPIDDYKAPRRQVKIPAKPSVPPPFPVQLREGESPKFVGGQAPFPPDVPFQGNYPPGSGPRPPGPEWPPANGSLPDAYPHPPGLPPFYGPPPPYPPGPYRPGPYPNQTEILDEDDPSLYYPPPYDFYYPTDNSTEIPPGPLVPGIVLPPPPDFFSPLEEEQKKSGARGKGSHTEATDGRGKGFGQRGQDPRTGHTTSTPGPKYLPAKPPQETPQFKQRTRPKSRPLSKSQDTDEGVEVIPVQVKTLEPLAGPEDTVVVAKEGDFGGKTTRERYPGQSQKETPLYYYDGPGISQIVVTSSPKPLYIQEYYRQQKPSRDPPKATKNQIIYIFTSPDAHDFNANQVSSSTEFPPAHGATASAHGIYQYSYEGEGEASRGGRGRPDVPTPPRIENFHGSYPSTSLSHQYDNRTPSNGARPRGRFRFPGQDATHQKATGVSKPSNYYYEDINVNLQDYRQYDFGKDTQNPNPVIYYPFTASEGDHGNRTRESNDGFEVVTFKPTTQFPHSVNEGYDHGYVAHTGDRDYHPFSYKPQSYHGHRDTVISQDPITVVTPKPINHANRTERKKQQPSHGVSVITVKPAVLYSGSASASGYHHGVGSPVIPRPDTFHTNTQTKGSYPQKEPNAGISIVTAKPFVYNTSPALTNGETDSFHHAGLNPGGSFLSSYVNDKLQSPERTRFGGRPLSNESPYSTYSNSGSSGIRFPESSTPSPFSLTTPSSKYLSATPSPVALSEENPRKKTPTAQYQEYFEAAGYPQQASHLSNINSFNIGSYDNRFYIQSTAKPSILVHGSSGHFSQQNRFNPYNHGGQSDFVLSTPSPPVGTNGNKSPYLSNSFSNYNVEISGVHSTPPPVVKDNRHIPQVQSNQESNYHQGQVYVSTTPSPVHYQYPEIQSQEYKLSTPAPNLAPVFPTVAGNTVSPLPSYFTTHDVSLFDDATKNYFNVFGQKLNEGGHPNPTTPLPPVDFDDRSSGAVGPLTVYPSTEPPPSQAVVASLEDDIRVNFREPLPPINPNSEFIIRHREGQRPVAPETRPATGPVTQHGGAVVSYQLPGVDGKGSAGASHYYFLTPQPASSNERPLRGRLSQDSQQSGHYYQGAQRPAVRNYWPVYTTR